MGSGWPDPNQRRLGLGLWGERDGGRLANRPHLLIDWFLAAVGVIATDHYGITGAGFIYRDTTLHASEQQQQKQLILEKGMKYSVFI